MSKINIKTILSGVWQKKCMSVGDILYLLENFKLDDIKYVLEGLSEEKVNLQEAEDVLKEGCLC